MTKISFQGEHGAYSESAAKKFFGKEINTIPCNSFEDALKITENGENEYAVLPVENSIEGTVGQSIDAITNTNLHVIGEEYFKVEHCLIGTGKLEDIQTVYSHPQALGQCSDFIQDRELKTVPTYDTAGSVKIIKEINDIHTAAIASNDAGAETKNDKTSIIFSVKHEPGALHNILKEFNDNDINLTKIESRPNKNTNWEYNFFVDFQGHSSNSKIKAVLDSVKKNTIFLNVIGSYPIADLD